MMALAVGFGDLFDRLGTLDLAYGARAGALDGRRVAVRGVLTAVHRRSDRFLLTEEAGDCPDCSPVPVAAITLTDVRDLPPGVVAGATRVVVEGRLGFGFVIDTEGAASWLRLERASVRAEEPGA